MFILAVLFIIAKNLEATKMSFSWWMNKQTEVHLDNKMLFNTKKKWAFHKEET